MPKSNYSKMSANELAVARIGLDEEMQDLRMTLKSLRAAIQVTATTKPDEKQVKAVEKDIAATEKQMAELRAQKKAIQDVVDSHLKPLGEADYTIGASGIGSQESVKGIGKG